MNHKKSEWSKYVDDKALLRVNGTLKFNVKGYDGIVLRDNNTHCLFVKIYLKDTKKLSEEILEELKEIIYHNRIKFESQFDKYYIEFNSASILDFIPMYDSLGLNSNKTYKDLKFIKKEKRKNLKKQIEQIQSKNWLLILNDLNKLSKSEFKDLFKKAFYERIRGSFDV